MLNICLRMPNWVGDVVMSTPALSALRKNFPSSQITVVINAAVRQVLCGAPEPDRVITYERSGPFHRNIIEFLRCVSAIRRDRNDLVIIFTNSFSSALMMYLSGIPERIGYSRDLRGWLLTRSLKRPADKNGRFAPVYMSHYYLKLCEAAGAPGDDKHPRLYYSEQDMKQAEFILKQNGISPGHRYFLFHPFAGYGTSKLWPSDYFSQLARMLHSEFNAKIAFIGSSEASGVINEIRKQVPEIPTSDLSQCGIDLHLLKCVVKRSRLMVSTDSGPRHYGIALGIPTVCIMGPTDPAYTKSGLPNDSVVRVETDCGPCQQKECRADKSCMKAVSPEMVFNECKTLLSAY